MSENGSGKVAMVVLVLIMMVGSIAIYVLYTELNELNPDERKEPHEYSFSGTLGSDPCVGSGRTDFVQESEGNLLFQLSYKVSSATGSSGELYLGIGFDSDGVPLKDLFRYIGTDEMDGITVTIWTQDFKGVHYTIYVGEPFTVRLIEAVTESMAVEGKIV